MCLATPMKIIEIKKNKALAQAGSLQRSVDISLLSDARIGEYILAHADMAINKLSKKEAEEILKIINNKKLS